MQGNQCTHPGETPFATTDKRICPTCGKEYYFEYASIDFKRIAQNAQRKFSTNNK